ncbi:MAG: small GTP-binding protein, partial [Nitrospirae bacterium]|nr:small GTP-binding protein [Nitrospirota bacterium]
MSEEKEIAGEHRRRRQRHRSRDHAREKVILIGNPNVGKSVIFGLLTGKYVTVSNYPGTTVEVSYGNASIGDKKILLVDSPGVNNLTPMSEDEKVTRDILLKERPEAVLLVADAKNLKRALMLLIQIAEMDLSCVLDLNMEDEAKTRGIEIHYQKLSDLLHIEVIGTIAPQRRGIQRLKNALLNPRRPLLDIHYHPTIEEYSNKISAVLPEATISKRSLSLMILAGDESLKEWLMTNIRTEHLKKIEDLRDEAQSKLKEPIPYLISMSRIRLAEHIVGEVQRNSSVQGGIVLQGLNKWTTHPVLGIPVLILVIFGFYAFVGHFGAGFLVDFFEEVIFGRYL